MCSSLTFINFHTFQVVKASETSKAVAAQNNKTSTSLKLWTQETGKMKKQIAPHSTNLSDA